MRTLPLLLLLACGDPSGDADALISTDAAAEDPPEDATAVDPPEADDGAPLGDQGPADAGSPPRDAAPPGVAPGLDAGAPPWRSCLFPARELEQEVNTWRADVPRARFTIPDVPAGVVEARLRYRAHDVDHPGAEGWIEINGSPRIELPADPGLDNATRDFEIDVTGRELVGENRIDFIAFDGPEGAFFRVAGVSLVAAGPALPCPAPPPPAEVVDHPAPAGVSAFAALSPRFPRGETLEVLAGLRRPFTAVLLDFGPVYQRDGLEMFGPGPQGARAPNPAHLGALTDFAAALVAATPAAAERHLQLYLINGPGVRRDGYRRAYALDPAALDRAVQGDAAVQAELSGYLRALRMALEEVEGVRPRLVVGLEDNYTGAGAEALVTLAREAGWLWPVGRNPCGCGFGDLRRAGDFHEDHPHGLGAIAALPGGLRAPDAFSNDGWGFTIPDGGGRLLDGAAVTAMARRARETGLWFHLWYDPAQGYPVPAEGPRPMRFDHPAPVVLGWLRAGLRAR